MDCDVSLIHGPGGTELRLGITPAQLPLVTWHRADGYLAAVSGRLYHRGDLLARLAGMPRAPDDGANDAALALAAYRSEGPTGLGRVEGDYAAVVWDHQAKRLIGCRDPFGASPLYWTARGRSAGFSTGLDPLLDLLPSRSLSLEHIADFLATGATPGAGAGDAAAYEGVHHVAPGTVVSLDPVTGRARVAARWCWDEEIEDPGTDRLDEIAGRFGELLRQAVRARLTGTVGAHLSGGMDSTSVCLLALGLVRDGAGLPPLHALSLVHEEVRTLSRERPYVERALAGEAGAADVVAHRLPGDDVLHFDVFFDPPRHDEPYRGLWAVSTERTMLEAAAAAGVETLLTGHGADELLDVPPYHLAALLRRGRLWSAWRTSCRWALARQSHPWGVLSAFGLAPLGLSAGRRRAVRRSSAGASSGLHRDGVPSWITPGFARRYDLAARSAESAMWRRPPSPLAAALRNVEARAGDLQRWILAAPLGICLTHPFFDTRVVRFGLGVQARLAPDQNRVKPVLAEAMRGILPDEIRNRRDKRPFDELYYLGLNRHRRRLEGLVHGAPVDHVGILDKDDLVACLQDAALGVANPRRCLNLNRTLSLLRWLSLEAEPKTSGTGTARVVCA